MTPKTWKLAVRLAKKDLTVRNCIKLEKMHGSGLEINDWNIVPEAKIVAGKAFSSPPKWRSLFEGSNLPPMDNRGAVCFIAIPIRGRLMFVSFGPSQIYLNADAFERDFGLKVTLNSVDKNNLVSIDAKTPEDQSIQKRIQASHQSDVSAFGIDVARDLLKAVAGKPANRDFANLVAGSDTLIIHTSVEERTIKNKCEEILERYLDESYKRKFPWVDNVRPERDATVIAQLDEKLVKELNSVNASATVASSATIYLSVPEIIDQQNSAGYGFVGLGRTNSNLEFAMPDLSDYLSLVDSDEVTIEMIKSSHKVAQRADGDGGWLGRWPVYKCLVYETSMNGDLYILSEGEWYQVGRGFSDDINNYFEGILIEDGDPALSFLQHANENDNEINYIERIKSLSPPGVACRHGQDFIKDEDWNSPIEPCDFYTSSKDFIHVKNETSSSTLSHLFMQGLVSATAYKKSSGFRTRLIEQINADNATVGSTLSNGDPVTSDYRVVYAILRRPYRSGEFNLPFFSKVALKAVAEHLKDLNYNVGVYWIAKTST